MGIGHGAWGIGQKRQRGRGQGAGGKGENEKLLLSPLLPAKSSPASPSSPDSPCPMPHALCPIPIKPTNTPSRRF
ncbi:MAG: hypothetical protein RMY29_025925 [Nostoc sp. CreGUA01]